MISYEGDQNSVLAYFENAELQYEGEIQKGNIINALIDAINLPEEDLKIKKYNDYTGKSAQWDLQTLIYRHVIPDAKNKTLGNNFYHDVKSSEVKNIICEILKSLGISDKIIIIKKSISESEEPFAAPEIDIKISDTTVKAAITLLKEASGVDAIYVGRGGIVTKENWAFNIILRYKERIQIFNELLEYKNNISKSYAICGLFIISKEDISSAKTKYLQNEFELNVQIGCVGNYITNREFLTTVELGYLPKIMVLKNVKSKYSKYQ
ncbi:MAG: hypothetical protein HY738_02905 [Bacteroidia bacterium]|nr:hypothetical protein [Bacteroidia bacterium]